MKAVKIMNNILDGLMICVYCGDTMDALTDEQIKIFGKPSCCDYDMLTIEREKIHTIVRNLDNLKANLEKEVLEGAL
jgi:hypothetical protein